jgi:hypothetical protein
LTSIVGGRRGAGGEIAVALEGGDGQLFVQTFGEDVMAPDAKPMP